MLLAPCVPRGGKRSLHHPPAPPAPGAGFALGSVPGTAALLPSSCFTSPPARSRGSRAHPGCVYPRSVLPMKEMLFLLQGCETGAQGAVISAAEQ